MKKFLFLVSFLLCVNLMFAQSVSIGINDVDVSALNVGDKVYISLTVDAIDPGSQIWGAAFYFNLPGGYLSWDGTSAAPMPGITYINPLFPPTTLGANQMNYYLDGGTGVNVFKWGYGDGGSFVSLDGETFPVTVITLKFTYLGGIAPGQTIPVYWSQSSKDDGPWKVGGLAELYYNDFFEPFPTHVYNDGSLFNPFIVTGKTWTGAVNDDWFEAGNWAPPGAPAETDDVSVPATKANILISGGVATTAALNLMGGSITIADDGGLTTNGVFTNDGSLIIQSDMGPGFAGSYIDLGGINPASTGMFYFDRYIPFTGIQAGQSGPGAAFGWHYLSAPFGVFTTNGLPEFFVNAWDQPSGMWMQYEGPIGLPCTPMFPAETLPTMDAWSINLDSDYGVNCGAFDQTANFASDVFGVHTGALGKALGFGPGLEKWNMVANPYPSGLNVNQITFGGGAVAATYFYEGSSGNYFYWAAGDGDYVMPATNGFFVETTAAGTIAMDNTDRAHNADYFWKSEVANRLILQASGNDRNDILKVRFADDVTAGFDNNGDAHKLFSATEGIPQIYTFAGEELLAINALPETALVHMGFRANGSGTYTIEAIEADDFTNVVLEDVFTGIQTDLLAGSYTFEYNVNDADNRFVIHFTPLGFNDNLANAINIWSANQTIYVQAPATTGDIVVYNLMGQEVVRTAIEAGLNEIPMNESNTYYIVKVLGSEVTETGKVFIK